jgi:hypothetical protein
MHPYTLQVDRETRAVSSIAIATLLVLALAGCAGGLGGSQSGSAAEDAPYVGVFTGDYVDGKPLFRFPPIYIVGSRSGVDSN